MEGLKVVKFFKVSIGGTFEIKKVVLLEEEDHLHIGLMFLNTIHNL
jgi:hypothetical protein